MTATTDPAAQQKARLRKLILTVIIVSIGIHLVAGLIAGAIIVARYLTEPPAEFKVTRDVRIPAKKREHRMNMAAFDAAAPKPAFNDRMQSTRPAKFALPDLPKMPMDQMLPLDPSTIVSDQVSTLVGSGGNGSGLGGGGSGSGGGLGGAGMSFFGIKSNGKRVLLLFDVSTSVVNKANKAGVPLSKIQEETIDLISKLPISSRFGIVQFTQNYKPFSKELVPATDQNREAALNWIKGEWVDSGTMAAGGKVVSNSRGLAGVLDFAATLQPDVIFMISDASFQWRPGDKLENIPWGEIETVVKGPLQGAEGCKLHFIGFQMKPDDKRDMGGIVRKTGGKMREIN